MITLRVRPNGPATSTGRVFPHERFRCEVVRGGTVQMIAFGQTPAEAEEKARRLLKVHRIAGLVQVEDETRSGPWAAWELGE